MSRGLQWRTLLCGLFLAALGFSWALATSPTAPAPSCKAGLRGAAAQLRFSNPFLLAGTDPLFAKGGDVTPDPAGFDLGDALGGSQILRYVNALGGFQPYTFTSSSIGSSGSAGLKLDLSGLVTGAVTVAGTAPATFTVEVLDAAGDARSGYFRVNTAVPRSGEFRFALDRVPAAQVGVDYITILETLGTSPASTFFSVVSGKRGLYLLPLFPAAALLVGVFFDSWSQREIGRKALDAPALLLGAVLVLIAVAACLLGRVVHVPEYLRQPAMGLGWTVAVPAGLGGAGLIAAVCTGRRSVVFPVTALTVAVVSVVAALVIFPALNENKTARFICEDLLRDRRHDEPVILYRHESRSGAYDFYTRLRIVEVFDEPGLAERLRRDENAYIIVDEKDYNALEPETTARWRLVAARQVGHRAMRVFRLEANENGSRP